MHPNMKCDCADSEHCVHCKHSNGYHDDKYVVFKRTESCCKNEENCNCHSNHCSCSEHNQCNCSKCNQCDCPEQKHCNCDECRSCTSCSYHKEECHKCGCFNERNLCAKKEELKCFKHCSPISQPCDCHFYNHFTSRANLEFNGLIVVKNTGIPASGCSMKVRVTDRAGSDIVAIVSPGASVPIFVECLIQLEIACFQNSNEQPCSTWCNGEVIFDLEYYTIKYIQTPCQLDCQ